MHKAKRNPPAPERTTSATEASKSTGKIGSISTDSIGGRGELPERPGPKKEL